MSDRPSEALKAAVAAIYLADSSDYLSALWSIVRVLSPDMAKLLEQDESKLRLNEKEEQLLFVQKEN